MMGRRLVYYVSCRRFSNVVSHYCTSCSWHYNAGPEFLCHPRSLITDRRRSGSQFIPPNCVGNFLDFCPGLFSVISLASFPFTRPTKRKMGFILPRAAHPYLGIVVNVLV
jgi:hypothetical protein